MNIVDLNDDGIALDGFDPVSYWRNEPLRGTAEFRYELFGTTYWFANKENRLQFEENPEKYIPRYGGYCAYGMKNGQRVRANPENFRVDNDQLYLFYRSNLDDARVSWESNVNTHLKEADDNWEMQNLHDSNS